MIVAVTGWNTGFQKVRFAELLRRDLGYSLSRAKAATDSVLDDYCLELDVQATQCDDLLPRLQELGAKVTVKPEA